MVQSICLDRAALDTLMPMNLQLDGGGLIVHVGPTLAKSRPAGDFIGRSVFELFTFKRPKELTSIEKLFESSDAPLRLYFTDLPLIQFRAEATLLEGGEGLLLNLSYGLSILDAIRRFGLHAGDFATTDPTVEMLYLIEANAAAMEESHGLNLRLQAAKIAAEEQAYTDTLTGLKNRRALDQVLRRYLRQGIKFALMGVDLDYFKRVNDTLGHAAGDYVLQRVAAIMIAHTKECDTVVRSGGDEFLIVMRSETDLDALRRRGMALIADIEQPITVPEGVCQVSASIGVSSSAISVVETNEDAGPIMSDVDAALYHSKREGRARATIFEPGMESSVPQNRDSGGRLDARLVVSPKPAIGTPLIPTRRATPG